MITNKAGLELIKSFEGLRLKGYLCPAGVATVGYGHTGPEVKVGMVITLAQAEAYLRFDLAN
jgi:lysozyme